MVDVPPPIMRRKVSAPPMVSVSQHPGGPVRAAPLYAVLRQVEDYTDRMQRSRARHLLEQAVAQAAGDPTTVVARLDFLQKGSELTEALGIAADAARAHPDNAAVIWACVRVLDRADLVERALALLEESIPRCGNSVLLLKGLGQIYKSQGRTDLAREVCNTALASGGDTDPFVYYLLSEVCDPPDFEQYLPAVENLLGQPDLPKRERGVLHFALAYHYQSLDAARYFDNLHKGNALLALDPEPFMANMERLLADHKRNYTARFVADHQPQPSTTTHRHVFIAGLPRSGTTLLEQLLGSHSRLVAAGESGAFGYARMRSGQEVPSHPAADPAGQSPEAVRAFLAGLGEHFCGHPLIAPLLPCRLVEKSIDNWEHLGLMLLAFPQARCLHLRRDPLDTILSNYHQCFSVGFDHLFQLEALARYVQLFDEFMSFWAGLFPDRILPVSYETLVTEPEQELRRVLAFLELDYEPGLLSFHERVSRVSTASTLQVRQPIRSTSVGRWRQYRDQLEPATSMVLSRTGSAAGGNSSS